MSRVSKSISYSWEPQKAEASNTTGSPVESLMAALTSHRSPCTRDGFNSRPSACDGSSSCGDDCLHNHLKRLFICWPRTTDPYLDLKEAYQKLGEERRPIQVPIIGLQYLAMTVRYGEAELACWRLTIEMDLCNSSAKGNRDPTFHFPCQ